MGQVGEGGSWFEIVVAEEERSGCVQEWGYISTSLYRLPPFLLT